jgi:hypothetical protein
MATLTYLPQRYWKNAGRVSSASFHIIFNLSFKSTYHSMLYNIQLEERR